MRQEITLQEKGGGALPEIACAHQADVATLSEWPAVAPGAPRDLGRDMLNTAYAMTNQIDAGNEMHILLPFQPQQYAKLLRRPSFRECSEFGGYVRRGEQAALGRAAG